MDEGFAQQYCDSNWKEKSKEIKALADYQCEVCDQTLPDKLTVHHGYYNSLLKIWEHEDRTLWSICWPCHRKVQRELTQLKFLLGLCHPSYYPEIARFLLEKESPFYKWCGHQTPEQIQELLAHLKLPTEEIEYGEYEVTIYAASDLGPSRADQLAGLAAQTFPHLKISVQSTTGEVDCGFSVNGPDDPAKDELEQWFATKQGDFC